MKRVYVRWVDSAVLFGGRWVGPEDLKDYEGETYCENLGWVVHENEHTLYVAGAIAPEEYGAVWEIPKISIKKLEELDSGEVEQQSAQEAPVVQFRGAEPFIPCTGQESRCECESACEPGC